MQPSKILSHPPIGWMDQRTSAVIYFSTRDRLLSKISPLKIKLKYNFTTKIFTFSPNRSIYFFLFFSTSFILSNTCGEVKSTVPLLPNMRSKTLPFRNTFLTSLLYFLGDIHSTFPVALLCPNGHTPVVTWEFITHQTQLLWPWPFARPFVCPISFLHVM